MKVKLAEWANIAEVFSAAAIVVSLVFVGLQISEGTRETRAATTQAALDSEMFFQAELLRYADTWEKVVTGVPMSDGEETRRGVVLYQMLQTQNENKSGYMEYRPRELLKSVRRQRVSAFLPTLALPPGWVRSRA